MTLATLTRVTCDGVYRGERCDVVHFERIGDRATILWRGNGHVYKFYGNRSLSASDRGMEVLGGKVSVNCRRCGDATLTVLDNVG